MPDIRKQTGLPRYDPGRFTTPGSYSVNPTGDEAFAAALSGLMGLGSMGPMAMGAVKGPGAGSWRKGANTRDAELRWLSALKQLPARLRDMLLTRPESVSVKPSMETRYGDYLHFPRPAPGKPEIPGFIRYNPANTVRTILRALVHEPAHWALDVGTRGGISTKFPGTRLTPYGEKWLTKPPRGYLPQEAQNEAFPTIVEKYAFPTNTYHNRPIGEVMDHTKFLLALEKLHPGSAAAVYKRMLFQNQVQRGDIQRGLRGMTP